MMKKRALISVYDKQGIVELAKELVRSEIEIVSSGGTAKILKEAGISVKEVSEITGFSEMLDGRVKTLHPKIHAGILADRSNDKHTDTLWRRGIKPIDIVVVNLYPFEETIKKTEDIKEIIENIDIGGPTLIRAAAKNYKYVLVITNPNQYQEIVEFLKSGQDIGMEKREKLAVEAFSRTAQYDALISNYFRQRWTDEIFPESWTIPMRKIQDMRYGENPHQKGAFYSALPATEKPCISNAKKLQGKKMSYNNIADANAAINCIKDFTKAPRDLAKATCVIVKHYTPCGIASADNPLKSWEDAFATDTESPFGGIVAFNRGITKEVAEAVSKIFLEVIIAPSFSEDALAIFGQKQNLRLLELELNGPEKITQRNSIDFRSVDEGFLAQEYDAWFNDPTNWKVVSKVQPSETILKTMEFAVICIKHVKSNSVLFADGEKTVAIAGGQTSRVEATRIAVRKGGEKIKGSIMASDAYFPFPDCVQLAVDAGVIGIIHPGGSKKDQESIDVADKHGIAMVHSGQRYFKH